MTPRRTATHTALATAALVAAVALAACTRTVYIPAQSTHTERRDSAVERIAADTIRDTRLVWMRGDTVVDIRQSQRIHRIEIHDTIRTEHRDTIRIPYPVERKLTKWQQTKIDYGGEAIVAVAVVVIAAVVWLINKFRK